jgi:hypothetical protein
MNALVKRHKMTMIRDLTLASALVSLVFPAFGAETPAKENPKLNQAATCAALVAAAQTNQIPIDQIGPWSDATALQPGDSVTFLGTFTEKKKQSQWLIYVKAAAPDPRQKPAKKPEPLVVNFFDSPITFQSKPVPAKLRMLGPFAADGTGKAPKQEKKDEEFALDENFLSLGLDQAAAALRHWSQATNTLHVGSADAPAAKDKKRKSRADTSTLTPAEKRAISAAVPALASYLEIIGNTEGLEDLMMKVVKLPSVWSMIKNVGVQPDFSFGNDSLPSPADPKDWNLPESTPVYYFPCLLRLNEQPSVKITLVVTAPRPPLLTCGGVVGLLAEKADDEETYLTLRVVSAKCNTAAGR